HHKIARRILYSESVQRLHRYRYDAQRLARLLELPAGDGDHAIRFEMLKIFAEGFHGVKIILAQSESAGRSRGPGVYQRHLHYIELLRRRAQIRTAVGYMYMHFRALVEMLRI